MPAWARLRDFAVRWRAFAKRQGEKRIRSVCWLYKPSVAEALRFYTPTLLEVAAEEHANSEPLANGESSFRSRCDDIALVFMSGFSLPCGLHANLRIVDAWLPRAFSEMIEQLVCGSHLEQGGRWSTSNPRLPCDVKDRLVNVPWALESILSVDPKSLCSYLMADADAGGLFSPLARPQCLSRRMRDAAARDKLERRLRERFLAAGCGSESDRLAAECAVVSLSELSVRVMLSKPATPTLLSMRRTLIGNGPQAAGPAALQACLSSRGCSFFRRLRRVRAVEASRDDDDDDEEPGQDAARDEDATLRLMTLRNYLETMSNNWQGARDRDGVRRFNALLSQLDRTDPIDECNWKAHLDNDERANGAVVFVVATAAGQLLGTLTLQVQVGSCGRAWIMVADVITGAKDPRDNTPLRGRGVFKHMLSEPAHSMG